MSKVEFVFKFMQNIFWMILLEGFLAILTGILIVVYPDLLGIFVGMLLIVGGIGALAVACKIKKFTKFKIEI